MSEQLSRSHLLPPSNDIMPSIAVHSNRQPPVCNASRGPITRLSIIIPTYNESATIGTVLTRINEVILIGNIEKEVNVVDDCSKDPTEQIVDSFIGSNRELSIQHLKYLKHEKNLGKGAAVQTDIAHATGEFLLFQDADLECDPGGITRY